MDLAPRVGKCGLANMGNTCYMNSSIQLILHCESIIGFLLEIDNTSICNVYLKKNISKKIIKKKELMKNNKKIDISLTASDEEINNEMENTITYQLSKIINFIVHNGSAVINLKSFKKTVDNLIPEFKGYHQHDSSEFLLKILDSIYEECGVSAHIKINNTSKKIKEYVNLLEEYNILTNDEHKRNLGLAISNLIKENKLEFKKYNGLTFIAQTFKNKYNPVSNEIFIFQINTIKCQDCLNETYNYDYLSMLILEPKNTLNESFNDYFSFKLTDENYKCMACGANKQANKMCKIYKHSPVIFIQLKRFKYDNRGNRSKDNNNVEIPDSINIENFCDMEICESKSKYFNYTLGGISNHMGSLNGGHYTADCKDLIQNEWFHFNDSDVYKYDNKIIDKSNAYVLMYNIKT